MRHARSSDFWPHSAIKGSRSPRSKFLSRGDTVIADLTEMARAGWTQRRMAAAIGVSQEGIHRALKRYGIPHVTRRGPR